MSGLDVSILSIHWDNIRAFGGRPDSDPISAPPMDGEKHNDFPQSTNLFIQMPNGTGKTTTLHLLRSVCIGKIWTSGASSGGKSGVITEQYRRILGDEDDAVSSVTGIFKTRMKINGEVYGFEIRLNHESGVDEWWTETPGGRRKGWHPPREFSQIFKNNPRLIELFVFDGETSRRVRKRADQHLLEKAIRQFGGLSLVYDLVGEPDIKNKYSGGRFQTVLDSLTKDLGNLDFAGAGGAKVKNWKNCLEKVILHEKELQNSLDTAIKDKKNANIELGDIETGLEKIEDESGSAIVELKDIGREILDLDDNLDEATGTMLLEFLNPSRIFINEWNKISDFHKDHKDRKLPADVGKAWLVGLAEQADVCVCGEKLTQDMRQHIQDHLDSHLDMDKMVAVSGMQSAFATSPTANREPLSASKALVMDYDQKKSEAQLKKETMFNQKALEDQKVVRDKLSSEKLLQSKNKDVAESKIRELTETNLVWLTRENKSVGINTDGNPTMSAGVIPLIVNMFILEKVKSNLLHELQDAKGNVSMYEGMEQTREIIGKSLTQLSIEMREQVSDQATKVWRTMPAAAAEGKRLRISIEPDGLAIYRGKNTVGGVSGAQIVSACYSITKSIGDLGEVSFPLICDTPFAGFDTGMYAPWYTNITKSFSQVIALINTNEKSGLLESVWNNSNGEGDYRASVRQLEKKAPDGGKQLQFTEDRMIFNTLKSAMDFDLGEE